MSSIFDMFGKNDPKSNNPQATSTTSTSGPMVTETTVTGPTGGTYNGIGTPPSGNSYNGIGTPPVSNLTPSTQVVSNPSPASQSADAQAPQAGQVAPTIVPQTTQNPVNPNLGLNPTQNPSPAKKMELDIMTHLTQRSNRVLLAAQIKSKELQSEFIDSEHLLYGLTTDAEIYKILNNEKITPQSVLEALNKYFVKGNSKTPPQFAPRIKLILDKALQSAKKLGFEFISPEHLLFALFEEGEGAGAIVLKNLGMKLESVQKNVLGDSRNKLNASNEKAKGASTSTLANFTFDLTEKAAKGLLDPVVERSEVIERVIHILSRRSKNNPALVGEAGVGKTAIVEGLAQKIAKKEVPEALMQKRVLQLDLMSIIAGASHRGEFEERMKHIIEEIQASNGQIILFIDEMHNMVGAGNSGEGSLDVANFIKPALARGEMQLIGATTITEYNRYITKDPALERRFQPVLVPEPEAEAAVKMLKAIRDKYEAFHKVSIPDTAIESAVMLSKRYVGGRFLPDKAVDLIDEAASAVRLPLISLPEEIRSVEEKIAARSQEIEEAKKSGNMIRVEVLSPKIQDLKDSLEAKKADFEKRKALSTTAVSEDVIKQVIGRWTGIPVTRITSSETGKLNNLEQIMHTRLIGQKSAVTSIAQAVRRGRAGLKSAKRPIGSFIFLGPTGVGKTELAKTLAEVLFGQEDMLIRFDMTEYMEKHEVAKLLGAPPGYVGYEEGGKLTEAVKRKPYSVVLFDEVEKAHPDIFNILLQILDDGRLTDNKGNTISFKDCVVICTSNIGTATIQGEMIASGGMNTSEPSTVSTLLITPKGRQIMTIVNKVFTQDSEGAPWKESNMLSYFEGQELMLPKDENGKVSEELDKSKYVFPNNKIDTHAVSAKGEEMISASDLIFIRNSTTAKVWDVKTLVSYFKDNTVINAQADTPEDQLPTARLATHSFSPLGDEYVSVNDKIWMRSGSTPDWKVMTLAEYFAGHSLAIPAQEVQNDVKANEKPASEAQKSLNSPDSKKTDPDTETKSPKTLPTQNIAIHYFSPLGDEYIVVGDFLYSRKVNTKTWEAKQLSDYFGESFPLTKEAQEKEQIEAELAATQYGRIKTKVMDELKKFFRPELINRFDEVIIFEPLNFMHMTKIAELQMKALRKLMEDQSIGLRWTNVALKFIVREGFDPIFGARPLRRAIQRLVENEVSSLIIDGKVSEGDSVLVDSDGTALIFAVEKVKMLATSTLESEKIRAMYCQLCGSNFESRIVKNSTPICAVCGSTQVALVDDLGKGINADIAPNEQKPSSDQKLEQEISPKDTQIKQEAGVNEQNITQNVSSTPSQMNQSQMPNTEVKSNDTNNTPSVQVTKPFDPLTYPINVPPLPQVQNPAQIIADQANVAKQISA